MRNVIHRLRDVELPTEYAILEDTYLLVDSRVFAEGFVGELGTNEGHSVEIYP